MPTTTTLGFRVPLDSDPFEAGAEATRNLGQDVDDLVGVLATGVVNITLTASNTSAVGTINFPVGRFSTAPNVIATMNGAPGNSQKLVIRIFTISAASASVSVTTADGTAVTATVPVAWLAIKQ